MMFLGGFRPIDIIYGGSIVNLMFWIIFGVGGQSIIAILVLGRKRVWAEICWGILRAQVPVFLMTVWLSVLMPYGCLCMMDHGSFFRFELILITNIALYGMVYFAVMSTAIYLRYRRHPQLSMLSAASLITYFIDLYFTTVLLFLVFL